MGLDVTAYEKFKPNPDGEVRFYPNPSFLDMGQHDGLPDHRVDVYGEQFDFHSGYTAYGVWRNTLASVMLETTTHALVRIPDPRGRPFVELIVFADNEGCIGPKTSAKLFADFDAHLGKANAFARANTDATDFLRRYLNWRNAFQVAAGHGFVQFH